MIQSPQAKRSRARSHVNAQHAVPPRAPDIPAGAVPPLWLLALITASGTLGMHIFVPALPQIAAELRSGTAGAQLTVSLYLAGLAIGQLVYGVLSDRYGRRPVLFAGFALYIIAGIGAALAATTTALVAARFFQALGGCAGLMLGRAIVQDTTSGERAGRFLAHLNLCVTVAPGLAPLVGGGMATLLGWRSIFWFLVGLGMLTLLIASSRLPETRPGSGARGPSFTGYKALLTSRKFLGFAFCGAFVTTGLYAFTAALPFIFEHQLGGSTQSVSLAYCALVAGVSLGNIAAGQLLGRFGIFRLLKMSCSFAILSAVVFMTIVLSDRVTIATTLLPAFAFTFAAGMASPLALAKSLGVLPENAGVAAGLYGFLQMSVGGASSFASGLGQDPGRSAAITLCAMAMLSLTFLIIANRETVP